MHGMEAYTLPFGAFIAFLTAQYRKKMPTAIPMVTTKSESTCVVKLEATEVARRVDDARTAVEMSIEIR